MAEKSPKRPTDNKLFYLSAVLIFSSLFLMGQFSKTVRKADDDQFWEFTAMFAEIYKEINDRYVEPVDSKKLFEGALQGMFLTLDPHSQYMDPDSYNQLEKDTEGSFSGIGIHITLKDGILTVIAPIPGSPSAKAGIRPWDRIIEINGKKTEGITLLDAVKKLTGPTGTTVDVTIYREGETSPLHFTLARQNVKIESVYSEMLEDHPIGYARITKFSDNTSRDLREAIEKFKSEGAKGIIVDLRYNTGGLLSEAVDVSNLFIQRGKLIVSTKGRMPDQTKELRATNDPVTDLPLMILINKGSASASEIFAGAVKDHDRGIIVGLKGQRSFGKGSVQTIEDLSHSFEKDDNGNYRPAAIRLTTAKYYTPSGISIDKIGITPDIAVEMPKGAEIDLLKNGLLGDPDTSGADEESTASDKFSWDQYNTKNGQSPPEATDTTATEASDADTTSSEEDENGTLVGSAVIDDDESTGPQPLRIIPLDRTLFPDAEIEGEKKKVEEVAEKEAKDFIDYQLHVAEELMSSWIQSGRDPLTPEPTDLKPDPKDLVKAGSEVE